MDLPTNSPATATNDGQRGVIGGSLAAIGVTLAAFGAHALQRVSMEFADAARGVGYGCLLLGSTIYISSLGKSDSRPSVHVHLVQALCLGLALMASLAPPVDGKTWAVTGLGYIIPFVMLGLGQRQAMLEGRSKVALICLEVGTVVFAAALILMAYTGAKILGAVAPIGGAGMIVGWVILAVQAFRE